VTIQLTTAAAERVQNFLAQDPKAIGLRFGVKRTGCSGWAYVIELAQSEIAGGNEFVSHGVRIFVDGESLVLVNGTEIDFSQDGLNRSFSFRNPNVTGACGCGESFTAN
jgi:iron-sulfur cluster assembly protein